MSEIAQFVLSFWTCSLGTLILAMAVFGGIAAGISSRKE